MKMSKKWILFFLSVILLSFNLSSQTITLFNNNYSDYVIVVPKNPSNDCQVAIDDLRDYFKRMTGFLLPCTDKMTGKTRYIVFEENYTSDPFFDFNRINNQGFRISNVNGNLYFTASSGKGLINAVYTFLEKYLGCRFYAEDEQIIPAKNTIVIRSLTEDIQNPPFKFRAIHYYNSYLPDYSKFHKLNSSNSGRISSDWGGLWVHTMHKLLPPEEYFNKHPEYYALRNGVRIPDQLCLSNPEVADIVTKNLKEYMIKIPNAKYWSVSQMDNFNYCQCDKCREIDSIEGSPSGSIIRFVNKIAENFPDKVISTLAYQYSRKAPKYTLPNDNVNIMLCTIEADRSKPIIDDKSENNFYDDLVDWSLLTDNILIWDYVVNFSHLLSPFPNFHVLQPNIKLFSNYATMIFEQGMPYKNIEFNELRTYLISKLLWNPDESTDKLMDEFLNAYYGEASQYIRQYIDKITAELLLSGEKLTLYEPPVTYSSNYLSMDNIREYFVLLNKALDAVKTDEKKSKRVELLLQSLRYAYLEVSKNSPYTKDWIFEKDSLNKNFVLKKEATDILEKFYEISKENGPELLSENETTPDEYYNKTKEYFKNALVPDNKAVGKKIRFEIPSSRLYKANGETTLIDGVRGNEDFHSLWQGWWGDYINAYIDLGEITEINEVEISFINNHFSWIFPPESIEIYASDDGKNYTVIGSLINREALIKKKPQIETFKIDIKPVKLTRFVNVKIKNIGKLPDWKGLNERAWLMTDEIIIR